jgi:hypothetical protein
MSFFPELSGCCLKYGKKEYYVRMMVTDANKVCPLKLVNTQRKSTPYDWVDPR